MISIKSSMKAKGVTLKGTDINHQSYLDCYNNNIKVSVNQTRIGSSKHQLYTYKGKKIALTNTDDKEYGLIKIKVSHTDIVIYFFIMKSIQIKFNWSKGNGFIYLLELN